MGVVALAAVSMAIGTGASAATAAEQTTTQFGSASRAQAIDDPTIAPPFRAAWTLRIAANVEDGDSRPLVADGRAYVYADNALLAVDLATGTVRWSSHAAGDGEGMVYDAGRLFLGDRDGNIMAYDADTGAPAWKLQRVGESLGRTLTAAGGVLYVVGASSYGPTYTTALRESDGATLWSIPGGGPAQPVVAGGTLYAPAGTSSLAALDPQTGAIRWASPLSTSSYAVADGRVYAFGSGSVGNQVTILDAADGRVLDQYPATGTPAVGRGAIVTPSADQTLNARSVASGLTAWDAQTTDYYALFSQPLLVDRTVYTTTPDGRIVGFAAATGDVAFCGRTGNTSGEVGAGSGMLVWFGDGRLIGFRHTTGDGVTCLDGLPRVTITKTGTPIGVVPPDAPAPELPAAAPVARPATKAVAADVASADAGVVGAGARTPTVARAAASAPPTTACAPTRPSARVVRLACTLPLASGTNVRAVLRRAGRSVGPTATARVRGGRAILSVRAARRPAAGSYTLTITYKKAKRTLTRRVAVALR